MDTNRLENPSTKDGQKTLTTAKRDKNGRFIKGSVANSAGENGCTMAKKLISAIERYGAKNGEAFWDMVARRANTNPQVLIAVLKKLVPDMVKSEVFTTPSQIIIVRNPEAVKEGKDEKIPVKSRLNEVGK